MKTFKFKIDIYATGESQEDALANIQEEFDYYFSLDNCLLAAVYPVRGELVHEDKEES